MRRLLGPRDDVLSRGSPAPVREGASRTDFIRKYFKGVLDREAFEQGEQFWRQIDERKPPAQCAGLHVAKPEASNVAAGEAYYARKIYYHNSGVRLSILHATHDLIDFVSEDDASDTLDRHHGT